MPPSPAVAGALDRPPLRPPQPPPPPPPPPLLLLLLNASSPPPSRPSPPAPSARGPWASVSPWAVALCATGTVVASENAVALAALCASPGPCGPTCLLLGSLALADLLAGLGLLAGFAARHVARPPSEAAELGAAGLLLAAFSASACSLLAITADRYRSLASALTYPAERTRPATCALLALLWALCAAGGLLPALGWHCLRAPAACSVLRPLTRDHAALLAVAFLLLLGLMLQLDLHICRIARRHAQQIAGQRQHAPGAAPARRGVSTLSLVLGVFAACWTPFAVYALVADASSPPVYTYCLALPAACHSAINPLVYAFRDPDVQKSLGLALGGCGPCCPPSSLSPPPRTSSDV
ncbi:G-protein coupled receptor 12-like [Tachyglossus aculeatus]|uniref:G-protein coupled receptor 12-like n=1 Tax=Tachyglossus aculeatus TaxID=9261 RepID=UPI0018F5C1F7|nr:G-protein coupled receptor 12-like [Tachyglossus aculeatus]